MARVYFLTKYSNCHKSIVVIVLTTILQYQSALIDSLPEESGVRAACQCSVFR